MSSPQPETAATSPPAPAAEVPAAETTAPATTTTEAAPPPVAEGQLQPGGVWTARPLPEDDEDNDSSLGDDAASSTASLSSSILEYRTINGRTYHSDRGSNQYWGANDDLQNETLDIQHHVFTLSMDGDLHWAPLPEKMEKAVDLGTGTGLWCIDFGDKYPNTEVVGIDLSPIQPAWVPPNVHFQIDDFMQEWTFPENSLDYVHMRWLIGCVTDWTALFKHAYKALKPGGWIETFECNGFFESDDDTVSDDSATAQWGYLFREGAKKLGSTASFTVVRDKVQRKSLTEAGFTNINEKAFKVPIAPWAKDPKLREIGQFSKAAIENDIEGVVGFSATQLGWSKEEITMYAAHMRKELRGGKVHAYYLSNVAWAQKPEPSS